MSVQQIGNIERGLVDPITGTESTTTGGLTNKRNGTPYTMADVNDILTFKRSGVSTFAKLNYLGILNAERYGWKDDATFDDDGNFTGGTDNTQVLIKIINICASENITTVLFPVGVGMVNLNTVAAGSFIVANPMRFIWQGSGGRHFRDIIKRNVSGIYDNSNVSMTTPLFKPDGTANSLYNPLPCVEFYNCAIVGNGQNRAAVQNLKTGWETIWNNVSIDYFKGGGVILDGSYDTNIDNLTITRSGGLIGGVPKYALSETSSLGDIANAHHYNNLHIEFCRYYVDFDVCRDIFINNFKFEQFGNVDALPYMNGVDTDLTNPMIRFGNGALEVYLNLGMIITRQLDEWLAINPGAVAADCPYNIKSTAVADSSGGIDYRRIHSFSNVSFTSPDNGVNHATNAPFQCFMGSRIIDTGDFGKFVFDNFSMTNISGYTNPILLKNSKMNTSKAIYVRRGPDDISAIKVLHSEVTNCEIFSRNSDDNPDGTVFEFLDAGASLASKVTGNTINTYIKKYKTTGAASNQVSYTRTLLSITLTDASYKLLMGLTTIDFTNVVIDLSRIDASLIKLQLSANATIKTILGSFRGEKLCFLCDSPTSVFTFALGGVASNSIDGQSIGIIKASQMKEFIYTSSVFTTPTTEPALGTFSVTGTGQTVINIPHGLGSIPSYTNVNGKSAAARDAGIASWTANITNISITVVSPNSTGDTMEYVYEAKF